LRANGLYDEDTIVGGRVDADGSSVYLGRRGDTFNPAAVTCEQFEILHRAVSAAEHAMYVRMWTANDAFWSDPETVVVGDRWQRVFTAPPPPGVVTPTRAPAGVVPAPRRPPGIVTIRR